ncbi:hypothetical protein HpBT0144_01170 [Helicobacter pylori]
MWRIPEKALWVLSLFGGSVGFLVAMVVSRHKILKPEFKYGVSLICLIESAILYFVSKDLFLNSSANDILTILNTGSV